MISILFQELFLSAVSGARSFLVEPQSDSTRNDPAPWRGLEPDGGGADTMVGKLNAHDKLALPGAIASAQLAAVGMARVEQQTDADIAGVH